MPSWLKIVVSIIFLLPIVSSASNIPSLISIYATEYEVSSSTISNVISCETGGTFDPTIQSAIVKNGRREPSFGLAQIDLDYWSGITKVEATDAEFSINFLANEFSQGHGFYWTCYRNLYEK